MTLDSELGVLESEDVEDTLQAHFEDIRACYGRAGDAQRYAEGRVRLKFTVAGNGRAQDVWVVESTLGNYEVERCLVAVGRGIAFRPPGGSKATTFEYPVEFRSTSQLPVLEIDGLKVEHDIAVYLPELAACGRLASDPADAILYIEPDGFPRSVGMAAPTALDETVGQCMVDVIHKWKMSAHLPDTVMRAKLTIPPVIATAEVTPRRAKSGRRKH